MKRIHLAISTHNIEESIIDYSIRLGLKPCVVIENEYALWRNETFNISIRKDLNKNTGELRHLGFEDPAATEFTASHDVNGVIWEYFSAEQQAIEINETWPGTDYIP